MPPLLKPAECGVLSLENLEAPNDLHSDAAAARDRILGAALLCGVPTFRVVRHASNLLDGDPALASPPIYWHPAPGSVWAQSPLGVSLASASRTSLLICGYWLDECITFTALNALAEGYDVFLLTDASPPHDMTERYVAMLRLVQAGIVPTTTKQTIREWAVETIDPNLQAKLLALV